jgi:hypothetical protein
LRSGIKNRSGATEEQIEAARNKHNGSANAHEPSRSSFTHRH